MTAKTELHGKPHLQRERYAFLVEAAKVKPEMLSSLLALLPAWSATRQMSAAEADVLEPWMDRFTLRMEWMWQIMRKTLNHWKLIPPTGPLEWPRVVMSSAYRMPLPAPPSLVLPIWEADIETEAKYRARAAAAFAQSVDYYVEAARTALGASRDWNKVPASRGAGPKRKPQPWRWLALWQVAGMSYRKIAAAGQMNESSVRDAVTSAASRIGLELRAPKRGGRPLKLRG